MFLDMVPVGLQKAQLSQWAIVCLPVGSNYNWHWLFSMAFWQLWLMARTDPYQPTQSGIQPLIRPLPLSLHPFRHTNTLCWLGMRKKLEHRHTHQPSIMQGLAFGMFGDPAFSEASLRCCSRRQRWLLAARWGGCACGLWSDQTWFRILSKVFMTLTQERLLRTSVKGARGQGKHRT